MATQCTMICEYNDIIYTKEMRDLDWTTQSASHLNWYWIRYSWYSNLEPHTYK